MYLSPIGVHILAVLSYPSVRTKVDALITCVEKYEIGGSRRFMNLFIKKKYTKVVTE